MDEAFWMGIWIGCGFSVAVLVVLSLIYT